VVTEVDVQTSKQGGAWARVSVEDLTGVTRVVAFERVLNRFRDKLRVGAVVVVDGRLKGREDEEPGTRHEPEVYLQAVRDLDEVVRDSSDLALTLRLDQRAQGEPSSFDRIRSILNLHPGRSPLLIQREGKDAAPVPAKSHVSPSLDLIEALGAELGPEHVVVSPAPRPAPSGRRTPAPPPSKRG
jgi:DNA polymerase III subunit alpha